MTVQVDAHARPVEPGGDLLDVGRLPGAVQALHQHPAVAGEAGEQGQRHVRVETVRLVDLEDVLAALAERADDEIRIDAEDFAYREP